MSLNGLTGSAGLKLGPLVLETLIKHYFERLRTPQKTPATISDAVTHDGKQGGSVLGSNMRQEELLYDQAFTIVKVRTTCVRSPNSCLRCLSLVYFVFGCAAWSPVTHPRDLIFPSCPCCV